MASEAGSFYDVLGAFPEASPAQIRHAYRQVARRWHPDKAHPEDKALAERCFKEIADAYEVLSDRQQRRIYDLYLRCRPLGYLEVADPADPDRASVQVPFRGWKEFQHLFGGALQASEWSNQHHSSWEQYGDSATGDDAPLSVTEWLVAGGIFIALWSVWVWRHQRRIWLEALPPRIWRIHSDYTAPLALLMSPFFFGSVSFKEAAGWMGAALNGEFG